jgi:CheY-like chemotaxis protein
MSPEIDHCDLLIVDDEESLRWLISEEIQERFPNASLQVTKDGVEGYEFALKFRPRIVWTCIKMPRMDGLEMIKLIRQNPDLKDTKILVFTGYGSEEVKNLALASGADMVLSKGGRETFEEALSAIAGWMKHETD